MKVEVTAEVNADSNNVSAETFCREHKSEAQSSEDVPTEDFQTGHPSALTHSAESCLDGVWRIDLNGNDLPRNKVQPPRHNHQCLFAQKDYHQHQQTH
ncbi:MAG: hypothetical protein ACJAVI_003872 [Candidatus Azotimanducaceae bacterium]